MQWKRCEDSWKVQLHVEEERGTNWTKFKLKFIKNTTSRRIFSPEKDRVLNKELDEEDESGKALEEEDSDEFELISHHEEEEEVTNQIQSTPEDVEE